jgi:hypothetical protein
MLRKILSLVSNSDKKRNYISEIKTLPESSGREPEDYTAKNVFPDPWEGDWNDAAANWERINKERSL